MDKIKELPDQSLDIESNNVIKGIKEDQSSWRNCVWRILSHCLIVRMRVISRKQLSLMLTDECLLENDFNYNVDDDLSESDEILHERWNNAHQETKAKDNTVSQI